MGVIPSTTERLMREPKSLTPQQRKNARYYMKTRTRRAVALLKQAAASKDEKTRKFAEEEIKRELCPLAAGVDAGRPEEAAPPGVVPEEYDVADSDDGASSFEDDLWSGRAEL